MNRDSQGAIEASGECAVERVRSRKRRGPNAGVRLESGQWKVVELPIAGVVDATEIFIVAEGQFRKGIGADTSHGPGRRHIEFRCREVVLQEPRMVSRDELGDAAFGKRQMLRDIARDEPAVQVVVDAPRGRCKVRPPMPGENSPVLNPVSQLRQAIFCPGFSGNHQE